MKKIIIILSILLFSCSFIIICIFGRKATLKFNVDNMDNISIKYDSNIIQCVERKNGNILEIDIYPVKEGKTNINVEGHFEEFIYVHKLGIITIGNYLGHCEGDILFYISTIIIITMLMIYFIKKYKISLKQGLNRYANVRLLGLIIYIAATIVSNIIFLVGATCDDYMISIFEMITNIQTSGFIFAVLILPLAFIVSILITISNIILLIREGKTWRNMLGLFLGGIICISTIILFIIEVEGIGLYNLLILEYGINLFMMYITYLECILIGTIISGIISAKHIPKFDKDYIIILGCGIRKDGTLTPILKARVDRAIEFSNMQKEATGKEIVFVPSGGQGEDECISEAEAMKRYLVNQGIEEKNILIENRSKNTLENIKFSNELITSKMEKPNIAYVTTNYHVFRAGVICSNLNIEAEGIGAKTKSYYFINAFIREFIATLIVEKRKHIKTLLILSIILFIIQTIIYLAIQL